MDKEAATYGKQTRTRPFSLMSGQSARQGATRLERQRERGRSFEFRSRESSERRRKHLEEVEKEWDVFESHTN